MQPMTFPEFRARLARYAEACRRRDLRLGAVLLFAMILVIVIVAGALSFPNLPRGVSLTLAVAALAVFAGEAVYVLTTSRGFHREHAPRCAACGASLASLKYQLKAFEPLIALDERADAPPEVRDRIRALLIMHCPRCDTPVVAPTT